MFRLLTTRWYLMLLTLFAPALAFAQAAQHVDTNTTSAPRELNPGTGILLIVGLIIVIGFSLIFFKRYSEDWRKRSNS